MGGHANSNGLFAAPEVAVAQFTPLKSTVDAVSNLVNTNALIPIAVMELASLTNASSGEL